MGPGGLTYLVRAADVDSLDVIPLLVGHGHKTLIAEDAGIIDDDVDSAVGIETGLDYCLAIFNGVTVANSFSTGGSNFLDDFVRVDEIVNNDACTEFAEQQGIRASQSSSGTRHKDDLSGK